jgi:hypothetical protein
MLINESADSSDSQKTGYEHMQVHAALHTLQATAHTLQRARRSPEAQETTFWPPFSKQQAARVVPSAE